MECASSLHTNDASHSSLHDAKTCRSFVHEAAAAASAAAAAAAAVNNLAND